MSETEKRFGLTGNTRNETKGSQHAEGPQCFHIESPWFASRLAAVVSIFGYHLQNHTEQPLKKEKKTEKIGKT